MAFGIQINTSDGGQNVLDVRTATVHAKTLHIFPEDSAVDTIIYAPYPTGWLSETQSPTSMFLRRSRFIYTGSGSDPYADYAWMQNGSFLATEDDANSRIELKLSSATDATHQLEVSLFFLSRGA